MALTRRTTLLAGAALGAAPLLTGCSDDSGPPRAGRATATARLRAAAADDSTRLLARYDATLAAHPALGARLGPLRAEVARHAEAFGARPASSPTGGSAGSPGPSAPGGTGGPSAPEKSAPPPEADAPEKTAASEKAGAGPEVAAPGVPGDEKAARGALADAERRLADTRARTLRTAPPDLARLLASVAAAGAAHAYLLTAVD
ncbi:hypothetical protein ACGH2B_05740 [Streptomyces sp. BBFR2]|uniref:hypothetical protein n=1 Tax=Streptomyces sp. BBFR2 TaxID=3372854 RepID=UPI0037DA3769